MVKETIPIHADLLMSASVIPAGQTFNLKNPPVNLVKIAMGNGAIGNFWEFEIAPVVR